jgi:hypothetical protein
MLISLFDDPVIPSNPTILQGKNQNKAVAVTKKKKKPRQCVVSSRRLEESGEEGKKKGDF